MTETQRTIAVLGGAGGIGRATVAALKEEGARVIVLDLAKSLATHPTGGAEIAVDATDPAAVETAMAALTDLAPEGLDGFVHLAGWNSDIRPLSETPVAYFDAVIEGNLKSVYLVGTAVAPLMRDGGSMVFCSSGLGRFTRPGFGPYGAAKAGVISLAQTFALEMAPRVRVNAVGPGAVDTAFLRGGTGRSEEDGENVLDLAMHNRSTPLARVARPEDVAGPIRFLLGRDAAFMTGQVLWINGGIFMP